jgi:hypothetical protein
MVVALLLLVSMQAHAIAIGVNRASISFDDVLRDGYAETTVTVTTDSLEPIGGEALLVGEAAGWINFSSTTFNFSSTQPYELKVFVEPPLDAQVQDYHVNLTIITGEIGRSTGGRMGTSTRASFRIPITIHMTGTELLKCTVGGVQVLDAERGQPLEISASILNNGNVQINPEISVEIFDQLRATSLATRKVEFGNRIRPTVTEQALRTITADLIPGQYWASISVPACEYSTLLTFDVLEAGGIKDDGELIRIDAPSWAETGDIIPINAIFRNKGVRSVRASFRGTIYRVDNEQIAKVINTEEVIVGPDQTAELQTFFNPTIGGQYVVEGKVFYNSKLTGERSTLINVNGAPVGGKRAPVIIYALVIVIILILVLLILIRRKKLKR